MLFRSFKNESVGLDARLVPVEAQVGIESRHADVDKRFAELVPSLYEIYNPMPYEAAREMEVELAIGLRETGYGVWQA